MPNECIEENEDKALGDQNEKDSGFMTACINGNIQNVLDSLRLGADINKPGLDLVSPIQQAIINNHIEVVTLLLEHPNLDINAKNRVGFTPLMLAACLGNLEVLQLLLAQSGVEINAVDEELNWSALMMACSRGLSEVAKELLINSDVNQVGQNGETAILLACIKGDILIVKMLLEKEGIDINIVTGDGVTVFAFSLREYEEIAQLLLRQADLEIHRDMFFNPLQMAPSKEEVDIVRELIRFGCDEYKRSKCYTVIGVTVAECDHPDKVLKIVDMLLAAGCKPTKEDVKLALHVPRLQGILRHENQVPSTLKTLCRKVIWTHLRRCSNGKNIQPLVDQLGIHIPEILVNYLQFVSSSKYFC